MFNIRPACSVRVWIVAFAALTLLAAPAHAYREGSCVELQDVPADECDWETMTSGYVNIDECRDECDNDTDCFAIQWSESSWCDKCTGWNIGGPQSVTAWGQEPNPWGRDTRVQTKECWTSGGATLGEGDDYDEDEAWWGSWFDDDDGDGESDDDDDDFTWNSEFTGDTAACTAAFTSIIMGSMFSNVECYDGCPPLSLKDESLWCDITDYSFCCGELEDCCPPDEGAIAGLVIGIVVFMVASITLCAYCCKCCCFRPAAQAQAPAVVYVQGQQMPQVQQFQQQSLAPAQPVQGVPAGNFCTHCGAPKAAGSAFCSSCGKQ